MAFHIYWPALACLTLFVVGVIMVILRHGPRLCKVRHTAFADEEEEVANGYDHPVSYA